LNYERAITGFCLALMFAVNGTTGWSYETRFRSLNQIASSSIHGSGISHSQIQRFAESRLSCRSHTRWIQKQRVSPREMSTRDDDIKAEQSNFAEVETLNKTETISFEASKSTKSPSRLWRTVVLAVPLMLKFAIVLLIKFLTDLVVFPLLFTYRGARLAKRRLFRMWNHRTSSTGTTTDSSISSELNLENYSPNGSAPSINNSNIDLAP
jgi:hypothetical protein